MNAAFDLFGQLDTAADPLPHGTRHRTVSKGYARRPGSGPAGATCGTCAHCSATGGNRRYYKCAIIEHRWTHGPGTDILKRSPACELYEHRR